MPIALTRAEDPRKSSMTRSKITSLLPGKPVFSCIHRLSKAEHGAPRSTLMVPSPPWQGRLIAFAGIARPQKLVVYLLRKAGIVVSWSFDFPDHCQYREADMSEVLSIARKESDTPFIITTEKDMVMLPVPVSPICSGSSIGTGLPRRASSLLRFSPGKSISFRSQIAEHDFFRTEWLFIDKIVVNSAPSQRNPVQARKRHVDPSRWLQSFRKWDYSPARRDTGFFTRVASCHGVPENSPTS